MISLFLLFIFWGLSYRITGRLWHSTGLASSPVLCKDILDPMDLRRDRDPILFREFLVYFWRDGRRWFLPFFTFSVLLSPVNGYFVVYFLYFFIHLFCFRSSKRSASMQHLYSLSSPSNPLSSNARQCLVRKLNRIGMFEAKSRRRCQANRLPNPPFPRKLRTCQSGRVSFYGGTGNAGSEPSFTLGSWRLVLA